MAKQIMTINFANIASRIIAGLRPTWESLMDSIYLDSIINDILKAQLCRIGIEPKVCFQKQI